MIPGFRDVFAPVVPKLRRVLSGGALFAAGAAAALGAAALAGAFRPAGPAAYADLPGESADAVFRRARTLLAAGDSAAAGALYRDLAAARPLDANARLHLGIHLQDLERDPFAALGEYGAFLRLDPEGEKAPLVRERIRACELDIARRFHAADAAAAAAPPDAVAAAEARARALSAELDSARAETAAARETLAATVSERDQLKRTNESLQKQIDTLKVAGSNARPPRDDLTARFDRLSENAGDLSSTPTAEPVRVADYMTYEVRRGDTLWKIAQSAYHDGSRTAEIKAANPGLIGADGTVREGTILKIPR